MDNQFSAQNCVVCGCNNPRIPAGNVKICDICVYDCPAQHHEDNEPRDSKIYDGDEFYLCDICYTPICEECWFVDGDQIVHKKCFK